MLDKVQKNHYGFYELIEKPTAEKQKKDFEENYYQKGLSGSYAPQYTEEECLFLYHKIAQKEISIWKCMEGEKRKLSILDIGCGEGFLLDYFLKKGCQVYGIDFSRFGMESQNPHLLPYLYQGDCYEILQALIEKEDLFDLVNMDATLDMVQNPARLLELIHKILKPDGLLCCKVANNYSDFQLRLLSGKTLTKEHWLDEDGHPWYFNKDGYLNFMDANGYECRDFYAESLIEFSLLNELTNYYENPKTGKAAYWQKIRLENMWHEISPERTHGIMRQFGQMGLGRELVGIFRRKRS